ncbi:hypothetical protein ANN_24601 [Periplaneta americana]|uniref:Uncharacterized protein n=1 Tax=Periplaneta americana TaxID=6978 RepID=A0ABQ8S3T4_PERAM|nr:hypothetical protein ANN_24601 [Periplaneta americana]
MKLVIANDTQDEPDDSPWDYPKFAVRDSNRLSAQMEFKSKPKSNLMHTTPVDCMHRGHVFCHSRLSDLPSYNLPSRIQSRLREVMTTPTACELSCLASPVPRLNTIGLLSLGLHEGKGVPNGDSKQEELAAKINSAAMEIHQHGLDNVQQEVRRRAEACLSRQTRWPADPELRSGLGWIPRLVGLIGFFEGFPQLWD